MKKINKLIFALTAILTVSCVSTKVASNKDPDFNPRFSRVFVTFQDTDRSNDFMNSLAVKLKSELGKRGVECTLHVDHITALALESESDIVANNISSSKIYNAEAVVSIKQTENRTYRGSTTGSTLSISVYLPNNNKPVWKGVLTIDTISVLPDLAVNSAVALADKLQSDQIIN